MPDINGTPGDDKLKGTTAGDNIKGGKGDDSISGNSGNDVVKAGQGEDLVHGNAGDDVLYGEAGDDTLFGDDGNDKLFGGDGSDTLSGGAGDDILKGGGGYDGLTGGLGKDEFVFRQVEGIDPLNDSRVINDNLALREFNRGSYDSVWQWTKATDVNFGQGDFVRITGFTNLFSAIKDHNFANSQGDYLLDDQSDVTSLYNFLKSDAGKAYGDVFVKNGSQNSVSFVLKDDSGHAQVLELGHLENFDAFAPAI